MFQLHVNGHHQDMFADFAPFIFQNRQFWLELLHEKISIPCKDNTLEESLSVILSSTEMQAVARIMSIKSIFVNDHLRFMAAHTHQFVMCDWNARCMSNKYDAIEATLEDLNEHLEIFLNVNYMNDIFKDVIQKLPPLSYFLKHKQEEKELPCVKNDTEVEFLVK